MPLITVPYTTRVLGADLLGVNNFYASIVQWFVIFGIMGINIYGNRQIARVRDDKNELSKTFFEIYLMQMINLFTVGIIFLLFVYITNFDYRNIMLIQGITLLSVMFDITWFFYGVEDFKKAALRNMFIKVLGVALIFLLVKGHDDFVTFVLINTVTAVFGQIIMWVQLRKYIGFSKVTLKGAYSHFKPNLTLFVPQIAISIYVVLDQTMIGILSEEANVAFYTNSQRFVKMFLVFITSIGAVMLPRIANTFHKGDVEQVNKYISTTLRLALYLAIPMMFGMMSVAPFFINWFLPVEFEVVGPLIVITAPIILAISISNVFGVQYMIPTGMSKEYSISVIVGAFTNLVLNVILIPFFGAFGAAIGSVGAELMVTITQYRFIRSKIDLKVSISSVVKYLVSATIMLVVVIFIGRNLGSNPVTNVIQAGAGAIIYMGLITLMKEEFHFKIIKKVLKR
jgi:O-antigen/teichoic acid export membrane protein